MKKETYFAALNTKCLKLQLLFLLACFNANAIIEITSTSCICLGGTGAIELTVEPDPGMQSAGPFTFEWKDPSGNVIWTNEDLDCSTCATEPGVYTVTVSNAYGCAIQLNATLEHCSNPLSISSMSYSCVCLPNGIGFIELELEGGNGGFLFDWIGTPMMTLPAFQNVQNPQIQYAGTYAVTVTDGQSSCTAVADIEVTNCDFDINLFTTNINHVCETGDVGSISIQIPTGMGEPSYYFNWSSAENPSEIIYSTTSQNGYSIFENLEEGEYCVKILSSNGCVSGICGLFVESYNPPTISYSITPASSSGASDGSIDLSVFGENSPYSFVWSNGLTTSNIFNLSAGIYCVTISNANGSCQESLCIQLYDCDMIQGEITLSADVYACTNSGNDGMIDLFDFSNLFEGYQFEYLWSNDETTEDIQGLKPGEYCVDLSIDDCIAGSACFTVCHFFAEINPVSSPTCSGQQIRVYVTNSQGPFSYLWNNGESESNIFAEYGAEYCVLITDLSSNCSAITCKTIFPHPIEITANIINSTFGNSNGSITAIPDGGITPYSYLWNTTPPSTSQTISNLPPGQYTVTITDACGTTKSMTLEIECEFGPKLINASISHVYCNAGLLGEISIFNLPSDPNMQFEFNWSNGAGNTPTIQNLTPGQYSVTVLESNSGCYAQKSFVVNKIGNLIVNLESEPGCAGGGILGEMSAIVTAGQTPYTYTWYKHNLSLPPPGLIQIGSNTSSISGLSNGWYYVSVTDMSGCFGSDEEYLKEEQTFEISPIVTSPIVCFGEMTSVSIDVIGNIAPINYFTWKNTITSAIFTTQVPFTANIGGGNWVVTATDMNGCIATNSFGVLEINLETEADVKHICVVNGSDGYIHLIPEGDYSYSWSNGQTTEDIDNLSTGSYTVTIIDNNTNCSHTQSYELAYRRALGGGSTDSDPCPNDNNGTLNVAFMTVGVGFEGTWETIWSNGETSANLSNLSAGLYTVTATNSYGCSITRTFSLVESPVIYINNIEHVPLCLQSSGGAVGAIDVTVTGSLGLLDFSWSNGATTEDISGLIPGTYTIQATNMQNGCDAVSSIEIKCCTNIDLSGGIGGSSFIGNFNASINEINGLTTPSSNDGSIDISVNPSNAELFYFWSGPNSFYASTQDISGLSAGKYCVTITNGCSEKKGCQWIDYCGDNETTLTVSYQNSAIECLFPNKKADLNVKTGGTIHYPEHIPVTNYNWGNDQVSATSSAFFTWNDHAEFNRKFIVNYEQAVINDYHKVIVTDKAGCESEDGDYVKLAYKDYDWRWGDLEGDIGAEAANYFKDYVDNSPQYNFSFDEGYIKGCKEQYQCLNIIQNGTNTGLTCLQAGGISSNPIIYNCSCTAPSTINVICSGDNPTNTAGSLPDPLAYNAELVTSTTIETSQCGRREYCLYYEPEHGPFVFKRDFQEDPCPGSGGGGVDPFPLTCENWSVCVDNQDATFCSIKVVCLENGCETIGASQFSSEETSYSDINSFFEFFDPVPAIIQDGDCGENNMCTCEELVDILTLCPGHCLNDDDDSYYFMPSNDNYEMLQYGFLEDEASIRSIPNPFDKELFVEYFANSTGTVKIVITNIFANRVWTSELNTIDGKNRFTWVPDNNLANGIYTISLIYPNGRMLSERVLYNK